MTAPNKQNYSQISRPNDRLSAKRFVFPSVYPLNRQSVRANVSLTFFARPFLHLPTVNPTDRSQDTAISPALSSLQSTRCNIQDDPLLA